MAKRKEREGVPAFYQSSGGAKATWLPVPTDEKVWLLEFFHPEYKKWLFLEQGRGRPVGPFAEQRAIDEMISWTLNSRFEGRERLSWRIRNLQTGEEILDAIVS